MKERRIVDLRAHAIDQPGSGGDYSNREGGHWLVDDMVANPMSVYPEFRDSRNSWGMGVLASILVEVEADDGTVGVATGLGGDAACYLIERHFRRFVVGSRPHDINRMWDQMYPGQHALRPQGPARRRSERRGPGALGSDGTGFGDEPVYAMIGGKTREELDVYATGPRPDIYRELGFIGAKVPLPYGPGDGVRGLRDNRDFIAAAREKSGPDQLLMIDCYMALTVPYAIQLAEAVEPFDINWIEEPLQPDDWEGFKLLKAAMPRMKWEHGRARVHSLRLPPAHRGASCRHPAARHHLGRWPHGGLEDLRHGLGLRYPCSAPLQRALQQPLRGLPAELSLLGVPDHQPGRRRGSTPVRRSLWQRSAAGKRSDSPERSTRLGTLGPQGCHRSATPLCR